MVRTEIYVQDQGPIAYKSILDLRLKNGLKMVLSNNRNASPRLSAIMELMIGFPLRGMAVK